MGHFEDKRLWAAIGKHDPALVEAAIRQGANPNARGPKTLYGRETVLQRAAQHADDAAIEVLLKHGARQVPGRHKATPLIALVISHLLEMHSYDKQAPSLDVIQSNTLRALDLLLAKRPNLEPYGGSEYEKGTVVCHALGLPKGPFADAVLDRLVQAMARQKKAFSEDFSQTVLTSAFRRRDPQTFRRLVEAGADPKALSNMEYPPVLDLVSGYKEQEADQWWALFVDLGIEVKRPGAGVASTTVEKARARLLGEKMQRTMPEAPATPRAPRF